MQKLFFTALVSLLAMMQVHASTPPDQEELDRIALQSYIYTYPMVLMEVTRRQMTNMPAGKVASRGPMNSFVHIRSFPDASFREVVRPNFDTLYSTAWVDVSDEPVILSVPEIKDRFYMLPMYDMWTDTFAVIGTYANGTEPGEYALCTPEWTGKLPDGVRRINVTTPVFWIIGRTQTNGPADYAYIRKIQDGFKLAPLSHYGKDYEAPFKKDPNVDDKTAPLLQVQNMDTRTFFNTAMALMKKHPPHDTDQVMVDRMARIGLVADGFEYDKLPEPVRKALEKANAQSHEVMKKYVPRLGYNANGWQMVTKSIGVYGNDYMQRATTALIGLGANPYDQAIYPLNISDKNGKPPVGEKKYVMHFAREDIPPVDAFWSITMYDAEGFPVANGINRFAIGDRDDLTFNKDGSLDIYIQHESPGKDKESNWLPSPASGDMGITMRLYAPKQRVLDGDWAPPYLQERNPENKQ
ncbi:DUF1254 domain-containing protein [Thiolapillus brandeum]|uniref:DUF1254 domain-containing protein n=1 Tax=Thiolapillus brandeum TaxID=1076588 RepID=A0A7U6GK33_9GAMM|nr:DUF1254 domain-containing protein [Thiolapillus brandeum]BAO45088.1 conserved hypothetical protein [Thiolapillus brandeum]